MAVGTVVALAAQIGGAKLADGLYRIRGADLAVVVNTGDDYEQFGLTFSPDLDTMLYTLAGIASPSAGWEPAEETFALFEMLKSLGGSDRLRIGDKSLAAPLLRSGGLYDGRRLTEITLDFCRHLGVTARILPASDDPLRTQLLTDDGALSFQEYFVELGCEPEVRGFQYAGADQARISDELLDALYAKDLEAVVICPSNPYHSIRPILEVNGMKELLGRCGAPVIAVTPIIGGNALKGSAAKMMRELGRDVSTRSVAMEYLRIIDGFVIDEADAELADGIRASGIQVISAETIMRTVDDRVALARTVLDFAQSVRDAKAREEEG
ncbi:MAG: 2-phospho-L-lactate transferase [Betaproteobacteria bacterium RIFCSPLOWO2_12_FULL_65_110]|nr:MAG: 2-phospho-L-lactate transferase [Betaproteobacteria bacterium RIFCSPLOWO2_02_FULL_65_20]OGA36493.1 MAG: 2-phospho-L-lactate transferase [Betaproteobacteria bacterium RIFCSPLOWO2_12_FULL_65_110]